MTNDPHKNQDIERLRGLGILAVMYFHIAIWHLRGIPAPFRQTYTAVNLFFVISGFVISRSLLGLLPARVPAGAHFGARLAAARTGLRVFFVRRVFRIVPLALVWILIPLVFVVAVHADVHRPGWVVTPRTVLVESAYAIGLMRNVAATIDGSAVLIHYWSLSVEEQFYLCFPFFLIAVQGTRRRAVATAAIIAAVIFVLRPLMVVAAERAGLVILDTRLATVCNVDAFLWGFVVALLDRAGILTRHLPRRGVAAAIALVGLVLLDVIPARLGDVRMATFGFTAVHMVSAVIVAIAAPNRDLILDLPIVGPVLGYLGSRSYGLYLCHTQVLSVAWVLVDPSSAAPAGLALWIAAVVAISCAITEVGHRLVERPLMRLGRRLTARQPGASSASLNAVALSPPG